MADDDATFVEYVNAQLVHLRRTAYLLCGDWHTADDLVSTALVKLLRHWKRIASMDILFLLVPMSVVLALLVIAVFAWALDAGQFDDIESEGRRILIDADQAAPSGLDAHQGRGEVGLEQFNARTR